ncbi:unnamed protein product, partial [Staurois parvus]
NQLCPITADRIGDIYTYQGTDDQCSPSSATCQCPSMPPASAHQCHISAYQCTSMPHISAHLSCLSVPPISAQSVPHINALVSATYQCCKSV